MLPGFPDVRLVVALSGGVDSSVLLAALASHGAGRLRAVHINHGIHPNAAKWAAHCRALGRRLGVNVRVLKTKVARSPGESLEAAARDARYALLAQDLERGEFLLTGHHEDDQLETVLLQLFRGAGLAGLAAMPPVMPFARGWLVRPLLSRSRTELEDYARGTGLSWVDDDTNADESLDRNYLRRQVLPLIRERWKGAGAAVSRSARHAAEGQHLLDMLARNDVERASSGAALFVPALRALQPDRRRNALRFWIMQCGVRVPDTTRLEELAGPLIDARPDSNPSVTWGDVEVQRHADLLTIARVSRNGAEGAGGVAGRVERRRPLVDAPMRHRSLTEAPTRRGRDSAADDGYAAPVEWAWRTTPCLELPEGGTLELKADPHGPIDLDILPALVTVSRRSGGERLRPRRGGPRRTLKSLLQESHLPIAQRSCLPLVFSGVTLLAVGALWVDESIQVTPGTRSRARLIHSQPVS
ncbi:MAG: tRNA lysidine(34) synthetase TilS [Proteobacteria bacterium]|nr:tRNA lysidine(34) synthetase TilS [Pseudomonadota bacterium]